MEAEELSRILRQQSWCRIKGELEGLALSHYHAYNGNLERALQVEKLVKLFITEIEDNGLNE